MNLTTFRRSGEAVSTPPGFALADGRAYTTTPSDSGKTKRIRKDPRVLMAPSNARGKLRGESIEGIARPMQGGSLEHAEKALREKSRFDLAVFRLFGKRKIGDVTLEVRPVGEESGEGKATEVTL